MALTQNEDAVWRFHRKALEDFGYKHVSLTIFTAAVVTVGTRFWEAVQKVAQTLKAIVIALARVTVRAVRGSTRT